MTTLILPFSLWQVSDRERSQLRPYLKQLQLPNLKKWFDSSQLHTVNWLDLPCSRYETDLRLNTPQEWACAHSLGWLSPDATDKCSDGLVPFAAHAAYEKGLSAAPNHGWAWLSWCHWQVGTDSVVLLPTEQLQLDALADQKLFDLVAPYFAEEGVVLHQDRPGHWLAHASCFVDMPTASLQRMTNRSIHSWLVGGSLIDNHAKLLRRLQNEVQMLLYNHEINLNRNLTVNSFWLHGTGRLPQGVNAEPVTVWSDLSESAANLDFLKWLHDWEQVEHQFSNLSHLPSQIVLCAEDDLKVYVTGGKQSGFWRKHIPWLQSNSQFNWENMLLIEEQ
jgi:hypothetical protein